MQQTGNGDRQDLTPLVLDVDGTLLRTDMLYESFWAAMGHDSLATLRTLVAQWRRPNLLKRDLRAVAEPDVALLPLRPQVLELARQALRDGRPVHLASGSDHGLVEALAARLELPGPHFGSDHSRNLTAATKAALLRERFGAGGYDYVGNSEADLPAWEGAREVIAVAPPARLRAQLLALDKPLTIIEDPVSPAALWREMRPFQWVKNVLLFLPLLVAHEFGAVAVLSALMAAIAFSIGASSIYILNDLLDLAADRQHPDKRNRPIASGALPIRTAMAASVGLVGLALVLALLVSPLVAAMTLLYMASSLTYSLWLKKRRWIDVASLALMFLLRVLTGAAAAQIALPGWLLVFVFAVFFTLACVKRMTALARSFKSGKLPRRGYSGADFKTLEWVAGLGIGASTVSFLAYAFSAHSAALYGSQWLLAGAALPLTVWLARVVRLSELGRENYDPIVFVTHDRIGMLIAALGVVLVLLAV
ncbi:MAG: UbiA family prenyltransferase [Pseudodonghicola sp.]